MSNQKTSFPESIEHLRIKEYLYENIPLANQIKTIKQEYNLGDQIADIFIELINEKKVVIEIQHSKILRKDLIRRTKGYNQKGCFVLWIINGAGIYDKNPKNQVGIPITTAERELHSMYRSRVYYINMGKNGLEASLYALHYSPYFEKKRGQFGTIIYKKIFKKCCSTSKSVESFRLKLFKHKGYQLAGFFDPNLRSECIKKVVKFIDTFVIYQSRKEGLREIKELNGLPLSILIHKFLNPYGLYLLLEVLLYLKFLTYQEIKYILEKELWFEKTLLA